MKEALPGGMTVSGIGQPLWQWEHEDGTRAMLFAKTKEAFCNRPDGRPVPVFVLDRESEDE
jgi:hypothetical protein